MAAANHRSYDLPVSNMDKPRQQAWAGSDSPNGAADEAGRVAPAAGRPHPASFIGNPAPLGLLAFGMTTCFLMFTTTSWAEKETATAIIVYAMAYGGFAQMVAGVLELIKGNTFAGTAFFSYGSFWVGYFILRFISASPATAGAFQGPHGVGETLIMAWWSLFTFCFFMPTLRKNGCLMTVFGTLTITFALLAGGQWSPRCLKAAGYVGFICGCSAIYTAAAEIWHENLGFMAPGLRPVRFI